MAFGTVQRPSVLQEPDFLRYLVAHGLSGIGNVATLIALPVLVYRASDDAGLTALVAGLEAAPYLVFGLFAGALTDRWNRQRVMVVADVLSMLLLATIPLAAGGARSRSRTCSWSRSSAPPSASSSTERSSALCRPWSAGHGSPRPTR